MLADGRKLSAVDVQWEYLRLARKYSQEVASDAFTEQVLERWEQTLEGLERDPMTLVRQLDWVAKLDVLNAYRDRDGIGWDHSKLRLVDLQYHDVRRAKSLYWKLVNSGRMDRLVSDEEIEHAVDHPPEDTRAYFRGECLRRFSSRIVAASWDALIFDTGESPLRKVPTLEPTRGTRDHVESLFQASPDVAALVDNLGA